MKVVFPKNETNGSSKLKLKPPLPLEVAPATEEDATKMATFKLRTTPADANSPVYTHTMRKMDGSETLRQAIQFCYDIDTVITGLHITWPHDWHPWQPNIVSPLLHSNLANLYPTVSLTLYISF